MDSELCSSTSNTPMETKTAQTETTVSSLTPDMLGLIFSKLNHKHLQPVALVSKSFLSSVRSVVYKLTFSKYIPHTPHLHTIFDRFPSVTEIILACQPTEHVLLAISNSKLDLQTLLLLDCPKNLQYDAILTLPASSRITSTLRCLQISCLFCDKAELSFNSEQFIRFIQLFPSLTELDLRSCFGLNDQLIHRITSSLRDLRRLDLGGGDENLTDDTLATLSSNCVNLEQLDVRCCFNMTPGGIKAFMRSCKHLHSLDLPDLVPSESTEASIEQDCADPELLQLMETISSYENLKHVSFDCPFLARDVILRTLAKSRPPLSDLEIIGNSETTDDGIFTMAGVNELIRACRGKLASLDVVLPRSDPCGTQDREMSLLVARLPHLKDVRIVGYASSLHETLESLKSNCPFLRNADVYCNADGGMIELEMQGLGDNYYSIN